jgi:hypothetical protein
MTNLFASGDAPHTAIPVLTTVLPESDISAEMLVAFERQQAEKTALFALSKALQESLRPELERLAQDVVQRTLKATWDARCRTIPELGRTNPSL